MNDKEIIENIEKYLDENHLSWSDFARELKISRENLPRWKAGRPMSAKTKKKLIAGMMPMLVRNAAGSFPESKEFKLVGGIGNINELVLITFSVA